MDNSNTDKIVEQLNKVMSNKTIFGNVQYSKEDDFLPTIQNLTEENKKEIIIRILEHSYNKNIYTLPESEFISILIRYL